jgi:hypothetical protein
MRGYNMTTNTRDLVIEGISGNVIPTVTSAFIVNYFYDTLHPDALTAVSTINYVTYLYDEYSGQTIIGSASEEVSPMCCSCYVGGAICSAFMGYCFMYTTNVEVTWQFPNKQTLTTISPVIDSGPE